MTFSVKMIRKRALIKRRRRKQIKAVAVYQIKVSVIPWLHIKLGKLTTAKIKAKNIFIIINLYILN